MIYKGGDKDWATKTPKAEMEAAMQRWGQWMQALTEKDQLVTGGSPLEYTGKNLTKDGVITDITASEIKELVTGYSIIRAEDFDQAVSIAKDCPIFQYPNITVERRPIHQM